jgi:signal transduction histidine kinase
LRKDGAAIWTSGSLIALKVQDRTVGFAKVVSDRTNTRAQIETLQNRLEGATRELELRKVFFGRLVHEVRNALAPVKNVATLLERTAFADRPSLPLTIVKRQVSQLEKMADDLTILAQADLGKLRLNKEVLDLGKELVEIADTVRSLAHEKNHHLAVMSPPGTVHVHADRHRIHQIVFNLLHNAIKYTPDNGKIWLYCSVEADQAVIRVEDAGVGIAPELLPVIFDLFTQESPENSEGGFGVGLSLVKDLVDAHNGFVEVNCEGKGKGAIFTVRLPLSGQ